MNTTMAIEKLADSCINDMQSKKMSLSDAVTEFGNNWCSISNSHRKELSEGLSYFLHKIATTFPQYATEQALLKDDIKKDIGLKLVAVDTATPTHRDIIVSEITQFLRSTLVKSHRSKM